MGWLSDTWSEITSGGAAETETYNSNDNSTTTAAAAATSNDNDSSGSSPATLGSVSQTGQYAGDGFEWVQNDNTNALTRVYTGVNEDAGLGQEVIAGGTSDNATKAIIAGISLNEGSEFANSQTSATDGSVFNLFRSDDDQVGSGSYAEQVGTVDYTPTITYDSTQTGAENAAATPAAVPVVEEAPSYTFNPTPTPGGLGSLRPVSRPTNILTPREQALVAAYNAVPDSDELYTPDSETMAAVLKSQNQENLTSNTSAVDYDSLGDLDVRDELNMSVGERTAAAALRDGSDVNANYTGTILPAGTSELRKLVETKNTDPGSLSSADYLKALEFERLQGTGPDSLTSSQATTPEIQVAGPVTELPSSADFAMPGTQQAAYSTTMGPEGRDPYDPRTIMPTSGQMAMFDGTAQEPVNMTPSLIESLDFRAPEDRRPLREDILEAMVGGDRISQMFLPKSFPGIAANIPVGIMKGVSTTASGLGQSFDQASVGRTNLTLDRMREMGTMTPSEEEFMIRQAGEEGLRMQEEELRPRDQSGYDAAGGLRDVTENMQEFYGKYSNYEGKQNIYKNLKDYEDVVGFEGGQVDPQLLDAMQGQQNPINKLLFGQGAGSTVKMDGTGFDPSTATQKTMEAFGTSAPILATAAMGPVGLIAGMGLGQQQIVGELSEDTNRGIDAFYQSGRLQSSPAFSDLIGAGNTEDQALTILKRRARDLTQTPGIVLGAGGTLTEASLMKMGLPGIIAAGGVEALQEGPGEAIASNQILASVLGFDTPLSRREILETATAGFGGGVSSAAVAPLAGSSNRNSGAELRQAVEDYSQTAPVLDPNQSRTSGQLADSSVQDSYKQAAESMGEAGVSGVGDTMPDQLPEYNVDEARSLASEMLLDGNIAFDGDNNILTDQSTNESFQIDPKVTSVLEATTAIILGGSPPGSRAVPTPVSATTTVEELAAPGQDNKSRISFPAFQARTAAINQKLKDGSVVRRADGSVGPATTPVGIAPNVDTTSAGEASTKKRAPSGVETVLEEKFYDAFGKEFDNAKDAALRDEILNIGKPDEDGGAVVQVAETPVTLAAAGTGSLDEAASSAQGTIDNDRIRTVLSNAQKQLDAGSTQLVSKTGAQSLVDAGLLNQEDTLANPIVLAKVKALLESGSDGVNQILKDNAAPAVEEDVAAVVEVAKSPDDIIAEQQQKSLIADLAISGNLTNESAEQLASQLGVDVITALDLVEEAAESMTSGEIDAAAAAAAEKAGSEAYDNFKPTTTLGKTTGILSAKDEAAREAAFNKAYEDALAASRKDLFVGTGSDKAAKKLDDGLRDGEATKLDDGSVEVTVDPLEEFRVRARSDLKKSKIVTKTISSTIDSLKSNGLIEEAAAYEAEANALADQYTKDRMASSDGTVVTKDADGGATVDIADTGNVAEVNDVFAADTAEQAAAATAAEQAAAEQAAAAAAAAETKTNTTAVISQVVDPGEDDEEEEDVIVELEEEEVVTSGTDDIDDTDGTDIFVPVTTSTDEDGNTINECPEGYEMVQTEDGPMCQKITKVVSSRQRAGAGTQRYTGGYRTGRGPGQARNTTTSTKTETVSPTTRIV